jgi:hypothetical protein
MGLIGFGKTLLDQAPKVWPLPCLNFDRVNSSNYQELGEKARWIVGLWPYPEVPAELSRDKPLLPSTIPSFFKTQCFAHVAVPLQGFEGEPTKQINVGHRSEDDTVATALRAVSMQK